MLVNVDSFALSHMSFSSFCNKAPIWRLYSPLVRCTLGVLFEGLNCLAVPIAHLSGDKFFDLASRASFNLNLLGFEIFKSLSKFSKDKQGKRSMLCISTLMNDTTLWGQNVFSEHPCGICERTHPHLWKLMEAVGRSTYRLSGREPMGTLQGGCPGGIAAEESQTQAGRRRAAGGYEPYRRT